nr:hypothetical protein [uncultured Anaerocolumna sp.]
MGCLVGLFNKSNEVTAIPELVDSLNIKGYIYIVYLSLMAGIFIIGFLQRGGDSLEQYMQSIMIIF